LPVRKVLLHGSQLYQFRNMVLLLIKESSMTLFVFVMFGLCHFLLIAFVEII
uniref:Uncharacterized protein n=1 Tax=Amphimedon queenslandica TaxID=400682 RepID=A0A1X7U280_AMPQE